MITWSQILYGATLSAIVAAAILILSSRPRRTSIIIVGAVAAALGPIAWNAILHTVNGSEFFVDAPLVVFPVSWQDTGSGVFATAAAALLLGFGPARSESGQRLSLQALIVGLSALVVDVYLY